MLSLDHFGLTNAGKVRQNNEDALLSGGGRDPALFAVADGIGGFEAGEVASSTVIESLQELEPGGSLESAIREANRRIYSAARNDEKLSGMGTTVVAVRLKETGDEVEAEVSHVGDSRAYLLRDGELAPLTEDHSLVAELVRSGSLTRVQASEHPQKNLITRALGAEAEVEVDSSRYRLQRGDRLVLCSDGLPDMVPETRISELASEEAAGGAEVSARRLVSAALAAGGSDNVTVVVVNLGRATSSEAAVETPGAVTADETRTLEPEEVGTKPPIGWEHSPGDRRLRRKSQREREKTSRQDSGGEAPEDAAGASPRRGSQREGAYARLQEGKSLIPGVWDGAVVEEPAPREPTPEEIVEQFRVRPEPDARETREDPKHRRRRKRAAQRRKVVSALVRGLAALALVGVLLVPPYLWWSTRYFMAYDDGEIAIYQGVPYDFLGNELNRLDRRTGIQESEIAGPYRDQIRDNRLYTEDRLQTVLDDLPREQQQSEEE